jgi:hypothetical protein
MIEGTQPRRPNTGSTNGKNNGKNMPVCGSRLSQAKRFSYVGFRPKALFLKFSW